MKNVDTVCVRDLVPLFRVYCNRVVTLDAFGGVPRKKIIRTWNSFIYSPVYTRFLLKKLASNNIPCRSCRNQFDHLLWFVLWSLLLLAAITLCRLLLPVSSASFSTSSLWFCLFAMCPRFFLTLNTKSFFFFASQCTSYLLLESSIAVRTQFVRFFCRKEIGHGRVGSEKVRSKIVDNVAVPRETHLYWKAGHWSGKREEKIRW